ncbi:hypothetical protein [Taklimakanibacter deserti]|uniref:hypothetical protein n=1 Tax=Taklimakanibacter deserti TaxID=2267839 RepID=UPI0013C522AD
MSACVLAGNELVIHRGADTVGNGGPGAAPAEQVAVRMDRLMRDDFDPMPLFR